MGCDIHIYVERFQGERWITVNPDPEEHEVYNRYNPELPPVEELLRQTTPFPAYEPSVALEWTLGRDYRAFSQLAGVRGGSKFWGDPKGVPEDISLPVLMQFAEPKTEYEASLDYRTTQQAKNWTYVERNGQRWQRLLDWHTPSYLTLNELLEVPGKKQIEPYLAAFREVLLTLAIKHDIPGNHLRIVFWFDN